MSQAARTALVLCHGDAPSPRLLGHYYLQADFVICTDGAYTLAGEFGLAVQVVVGDMDSLTTPVAGVEICDAGPHAVQNSSDAEKAVLLALERGYQRIVLLGATGGRLDHTLGNLALVWRYADQAEVILADESGAVSVLVDGCSLELPVGQRVSVLAINPARVRATGLRWELPEVLQPGTRGLSNEVTQSQVSFTVQDGPALLILEHPWSGETP